MAFRALMLVFLACAEPHSGTAPPHATVGDEVAARAAPEADPEADPPEEPPPVSRSAPVTAPAATSTCDAADPTATCEDDVACGWRGYCCPSGRCLRSPEPRPAELPTPTRVSGEGPNASSEEIVAWVDAREAEARRGLRRYVRVPLVWASDGWGCVCPRNYVGGDPSSSFGAFVEPELATTDALPADPDRVDRHGERRGLVVVVDGYFTGARARRDLRGSDGPPEWLYRPAVFRVTRIHPGARTDFDEPVRFLGEPTTCEVRVHDPVSALNVRERPSSNANVVGTLDDWTLVEVAAVRGSWTRITAPTPGWIWAERTITTCADAAASEP